MPDYRPEVLAQLASHGIRPHASTPPELVRSYLSDLYRYEIRSLRARLLRGDFPRQEYTARVLQVRAKYVLLSIPIRLWLVRRETG
jgi:hypothetical protein